ncbi:MULTISPECIES: cytochrome c-type biogenesis protein [Acidiphilium]|uniref:Cytochrome c-type biogenesis protein n=1 Tax=Acidiphilium rubrum TaxID=526 RepID=A0A8G2FC57_ACIRU|nr:MULTISPECIES: cytochrome c-type biogenesis protein [Acidiphilium]MBW4035046.1 cytochrome c-type biogenesis protein CcmH [Pseudomonadota bacterium]OYW03906.1 MAG: cytochrome C biogenesis protein [Acidiphilium sp. 37-64-53]OZB29623.1 MAG: cytochrome C biogenesis protein [Acidiphilium sp. 34-64-41]SIQ20882.1 cytochrome c-type biogenesis protein CcmH [Acidiphilium rubrum]HQT83837.1 cytochrome c-type biogenesis protein CcmH [Acidiphilium rubrum]
MKRLVVMALVGLGLALGIAAADTPTTIRRDGVVLTIPQEKRAEVIGDRLRCLVCQNETVENSQAGLAKQFRGIIRRRVVKGETNQQIVDFMVHRYGIFVLLKPPLIPLTWLLWFSPVIALALGLLVLLLARRRKQQGAPPLSPDERDRLKELLS